MQKVDRRQFDYQLLGLTLLLVAFGLVMLTSASSVVGYERFGDTYFFTKQQAVHVLIGLLAFFIAAKLPADWWEKMALPALIATILLLMLVFIPGIGLEVNNAHSWFYLGPVGFQPSEFAKLGFLLYLAHWLTKRRAHLHDLTYGFLPFLVLLSVVAGLILLQPDIGTVAVIVFNSVILYFIAGANIKHLFAVGAVTIIAFTAIVFAAPYRQERFLVLLDPGRDPSGVGYHTRQAMIAIGSGGWIGQGIGKSRQKYNYLPETAGDSIFAVMGEELGFVFTTLFIGALSWLIRCLWKLAQCASTEMGRFVIVGVALWISVQAFFNIGAMIGILPLTGLPLPFVSFGGSAILMLLLALGICMSLSRSRAAP